MTLYLGGCKRKPCPDCEGTGKKTWKHRESPNHSSGSTTECPRCGQSGSLCCNLKECPIEARKKRETVTLPMKQLTIEPYGDGAISIAHYPFETHFNKQEVSEIRAYLNKDVIAEMESWINGLEYPDCPPGDAYARVIALLKEHGENGVRE